MFSSGDIISDIPVSGLPRTKNLVVRFTITDSNCTIVQVKVNGSIVETTSDPGNLNIQALTISASEITGNINITATAGYKVVLDNGNGNCTIKSVNNTNLPANSTTATVQAGADATIVVEPNNDNYALYRACEVVIVGRNFTPMSYEKTGTLTIPGESITGDIVITSRTKKLPHGVHLGTFDSGIFGDNGYKYLTFDGVTGDCAGKKWIIIGADADDLCLGNNVGDPKNELGSGQVLLLSEGCIGSSIFHAITNSDTDNIWQGSDVQNACIHIYENSGLESNYSVVKQDLKTKWYNNQECSSNDNMFLLAGRGEKFDVQTYLTTDPLRSLDSWWWLRSGDMSKDYIAYRILNEGKYCNIDYVDRPNGVRPAFVLQI